MSAEATVAGDWLTAAETARLLGVTRSGVQQAITRGELPAEKRDVPHQARGVWMVRRDDVLAYRERVMAGRVSRARALVEARRAVEPDGDAP